MKSEKLLLRERKQLIESVNLIFILLHCGLAVLTNEKTLILLKWNELKLQILLDNMILLFEKLLSTPFCIRFYLVKNRNLSLFHQLYMN